jgi:hypothetical protein
MYWYQLQSWLTRVEVDSLDAILLYGGTVEYFRPKLLERFANLREVVWHCHLSIPQVLIDSILVERDQSAMELRFKDCWCFLHYLCEPYKGYEEYALSKLAKQENLILVGD